ncbi:IPTL-CTERM sorting domain-containing protein [Diaphorobacter sp. HDW4A]|uniref:IPTL-CTERM sorting domain-containing protein n=1 Tax=Diaphorobacter sp. HDW4A TaxID=2714924 RepID=UPI00140CA880|nr:IPTL-CTERM sorting domain-containing protein [Diaphorobacter sp. HDW4A]QIL83536.1 IPTL-CTERM sorting domain-containing protein [Diaphorobacter sp. HDW4A]
MSKAIRCALLFGCVMVAGQARAELVDTAYPVGTTAGTWVVDRYAPAVFASGGTVAGRSGVLNLGIAQADADGTRPPAYSGAFYNTQGRGLSMDASAYSVIYGSLYIPAAWTMSTGAAENRRTDLWGMASPATGGDTCTSSGCNHFPIIGFSNADTTTPITAGGTGRYRVFDSQIGWQELNSTPVQYDQWTDMCIAFNGTELKSYINGTLAYTQSDLSHADQATLGATTKFSRMIMQAYNFGSDYTAQWSSLGYGQLDSVSALSGDGQTANLGAAFANPLVVVAKDTSGAPLPCVPLTFAVPSGGASATLTTLTVFTDRLGTATVPATANSTAGTYAVTAAGPGLEGAASFSLTNQVAMVTPPTTPAAVSPVPTLNEWTLAVLSLLAALGGALALSRRKQR